MFEEDTFFHVGQFSMWNVLSWSDKSSELLEQIPEDEAIFLYHMGSMD